MASLATAITTQLIIKDFEMNYPFREALMSYYSFNEAYRTKPTPTIQTPTTAPPDMHT
jgi:hypothetical protein